MNRTYHLLSLPPAGWVPDRASLATRLLDQQLTTFCTIVKGRTAARGLRLDPTLALDDHRPDRGLVPALPFCTARLSAKG